MCGYTSAYSIAILDGEQEETQGPGWFIEPIVKKK